MDINYLKMIICSIIQENDPCRASRKLHLERWCYIFFPFLQHLNTYCLPFFLDVLSDEECWESTDTIHQIKLNRRTAAKKIVQGRNLKGKTNPLNKLDRFKIACWCCLEEDVTALFENFKNHRNFYALVELMDKSEAFTTYADEMIRYWLNIVRDYTPKLQSNFDNLYEYGLYLALKMRIQYVEALEFFWYKIKLVPENELSVQRKHDIFMQTAIKTVSKCWHYPEVFEFCVSEMSPNMYPELLKKDLEENRCYHSSLGTLHDMNRFDLIKSLFDSFKPNDISKESYCKWSMFFKMEQYEEQYAIEAERLFMHIWMKDGFDRHRNLVLEKIKDHSGKDNFLVSFAKVNCMEPVWAVLDKASREQVQNFLNSEPGRNIQSLLKERGNIESLNKFFSYAIGHTS